MYRGAGLSSPGLCDSKLSALFPGSVLGNHLSWLVEEMCRLAHHMEKTNEGFSGLVCHTEWPPVAPVIGLLSLSRIVPS